MSNWKMKDYNVCWKEQSKNAGESMPVGGFDIGCNVWVEKDEVFLYMAQSGAFDESGRMLKAGRIRISFDKPVFARGFSQELKLSEGHIEIMGQDMLTLLVWADAYKSCVHIDVKSQVPVKMKCTYETWRGETSGYENKDIVRGSDEEIVFYHRNQKTPVFDERIWEQGLEEIREEFPNVEKNRTCGGVLLAKGMKYQGKVTGNYINNSFDGYVLEAVRAKKNYGIRICLLTRQAETIEQWETELTKLKEGCCSEQRAWQKTKQWWKAYWTRSYVVIGEKEETDKDWQVGRNYQLFRYMLAANAYGEFPTKFNGGLFTVDSSLWHENHKDGGSPDERDWGGIMFTAQNQRLVYWPMIKSGDFDMMKPQFDFYKRLVKPMKMRTRHFFGLEDCACYCEQTDANGLSGYYGKYGLDYPLYVRYHHVQALEFAYMMLKYHKTSGEDISEYMPFIFSVLDYYDRNFAKTDENGKRIIFPSTAMETYHGEDNIYIWGREGAEAANYNENEVAVTNPADVISALDNSITELLETTYGTAKQRERLRKLQGELPDIPLEIKRGKEVVAPCEKPKRYVKINCEIPQLNTVYPYNTYGINKPETMELARNTYLYAWDEEDQKQHISWHPNGIYAARVGLMEEAQKYMYLKLCDSGRRFPAFWGPGHDFTPDHNWGGSGMIGVQEMLVQEYADCIYLLPAWNLQTDVKFKLWLSDRRVIEAEYRDGTLNYRITPKTEKKVIAPVL